MLPGRLPIWHNYRLGSGTHHKYGTGLGLRDVWYLILEERMQN